MDTKTRTPEIKTLNTQATSIETADATEHRGVSVLMADLVASTDHMEALGPEGYADLLRRFHTLCNDAVRARGGMVAQYQGDGIICYFGFPHAAEDDAARAVEAALDICQAIEQTEDDGTLNTRIGIASGTVMLRSDGDQFGASAVGSCINKAARLEGLADANTVMVCEDTKRLVGGLFQMRDLGAQKLKGFRKAQNVYAATRQRKGVTSRFEALRGNLVTELVGRDAELEKLLDWFDASSSSQGKTAVISGQAGMGKSRLVSAFLQQDALSASPCFLLQCSPEQTGTPLHPVTRYLEWVAGTGAHEDAQARHVKLMRLITKVWGATEAQTDVLLDIISPLGAEGELDLTESPPLRRQKALTLLADKIFASVSGRGTFVVVFEDVHWIDPTSAALLEILIGKVRAHKSLMLLTTRPEPPFGDGTDGTEMLRLKPLSERNSRRLAQLTLGETGIDAAQVAKVIEKSEGVPLFLQEYASMLRDGNLAADGEVPLTLGGLVQSKLDRLDKPLRFFAQAGAALGRSFDPELVCHVLDRAPSEAESFVSLLNAAGLTQSVDAAAAGESLSFTHALVRDATYNGMSGKRRRAVHDAIVNVLMASDNSTTAPDNVLADHLAKAGRHEEAVASYFSAGRTEAMKGAAAEAMSHLDAGLACIPSMPEGEARDLAELQLCAVRGPTLMVTRGPGSPDFGACQVRAMELVEKLDLHVEMVPVIFNTAENAWAVADLSRAWTMAEAVQMIDGQQPSDAAHMAGYLLQGMVAWHRGQNDLAASAFEKVIARYDAEKHAPLYGEFIKDFGVFSNFYLGLTRTIQGDFETGRRLAETAITLSDTLGFPHEKGFALLARFNTALLRGDVETARAASAEAHAFSGLQGFPEFVAMADVTQGWCACKDGLIEEGVARMQAGYDFWCMTGFMCWQSFFAALMAPWMVELGRVDEASEMVEKYISFIDETGEEQTRAPLLLARAVVQTARGDEAGASATAAAAREVADAQGAALWHDWIDVRFPK